MTHFVEQHSFSLTPLSPIHVGAGEDLDWTTSYIDGSALVLFDSIRVAIRLEEKTLAAIDKALGNADPSRIICDLQRVYRENRAALSQGARRFVSVLPDLAEHMQNALGQVSQREDRRSIVNELAVARTMVEPLLQRPYIPGSTLKGAIRTAWLDALPAVRGRKDGSLDESAMLGGSFDKDPFRLVGVADLSSDAGARTVIVEARNVRRQVSTSGRDEGKGLPVRVEAIAPFLAGALRGGVVLRKLNGKTLERDVQLATPELDEILTRINRFHIGLFRAQREQLRGLRHHVDQDWLSSMETLVGRIDKGEGRKVGLVRIGKFCTAEAKTVSERQISVRVGRSQTDKRRNGTTFWLAGDRMASGRLPFGWALIEFGDGGPSAATADWCARMRRGSKYDLPESPNLLVPGALHTGTRNSPTSDVSLEVPTKPPSPPRERVIPTPSNEIEQTLFDLETAIDRLNPDEAVWLGQGSVGGAVRNSMNQAVRGWAVSERRSLARLIDEKLAGRLKVRNAERVDFERRLTQLRK